MKSVLIMTCKDCIHFDVCKIIHFPSLFGLTGDACDHFKPKSRFIELPCEVGQKVYWINFVSKQIETDKVISLHLYEDGFSITTKTISNGSKAISTYTEDRFKRIMFLYREEAEKALEERNKKGK